MVMKINEPQLLKEIKKGQTGYGILIESDGYIDPNVQKNILQENRDSGDFYIPFPYVVSAVFQRADHLNANGRIYPRSILEKEIKKYQEKINERRAYAENDHPDSVVISVKGISLNVTKLWFEGKTVVGEMEILCSPGYVKYGICSTPGDILANSIYYNRLKLGVSSRGVGEVVSKGGVSYVTESFELLGFDAVTDPSTSGAFIGKELSDLTQYIENNNKVVDNKKIIIEKVDRVLGLL